MQPEEYSVARRDKRLFPVGSEISSVMIEYITAVPITKENTQYGCCTIMGNYPQPFSRRNCFAIKQSLWYDCN